MARRMRSSKLETRSSRLRLPIRKKPFFVTIAPGVAVGYRRNAGPGTWSTRAQWLKKIGLADDYEVANGETVLDFWQAQAKSLALARGNDKGTGDRPATVAEAVDDYEDDLRARGASIANATGIRFNLSKTLAAKVVGTLTAKELRDWRNGLVKRGLEPASADRIGRSLKAALNHAASNDPRIANAQAWRDGLKKLPDSETARNVILPDATVQAIVRGAYEADHAVGVFIETLANTGCRESQLLRVEVADLLDDPKAPRLMMPGSFKGKSRKVERKPIAISASLAATLRRTATGRAPHERLLDRIKRLDKRFRPIADALKLPREVGLYALRHSSIVRQLLAGVPVRVVASGHDTSTVMIEQNYSRYIIGDPTDAMVRRTLLDFTAPPAGDNVLPITGRK
jgi:integrase